MIQVREYARLTTEEQSEQSLDCGVVSASTFDWLLELVGCWKGAEPVASLDGRRSLKLGSYVGFLQSPTGESIEILPKTGLGVEDPLLARSILQRMLMAALGVKPRIVGPANLLRMRQPLNEWIFSQFLNELQLLIGKGLRFEYIRVEDESRFIRGQLRIEKQQRQAPARKHYFHISHDNYSPDRLENRLLKTALSYVLNACKSSENWRLANELSHHLTEIPSENNPTSSMCLWKTNKLMQIYDPVGPWCELILEKLNPNFQQGHHRGIALLFPMEKLFEKYVEISLRKRLDARSKLKPQASSEYLLKHALGFSDTKKEIFQLQPDLLLQTSSGNQVIDCKWKLLNEFAWNSNEKYGIDQDDLYQLFAYGHKYQNGQGHMMLIYPKHQKFSKALKPFYFSEEFAIWAIPFCLEECCLVPGVWIEHFPYLFDKELAILSGGL